MKLNEVTLYENKTHRILKEGYRDLTEAQQLYMGRWEKELWPLLEEYKTVMEAQLTSDQIDAIFTSAETQAMASGDNKNMLGKAGSAAGAALKVPVEIAKKVDAKINELGRAAKEAGPVKDMDAKFKQLKADIDKNNPDSKIVQGIKDVSDWAKANPGKASVAVGILTAVAAFAGGPAGGAAAGLLLRSTKELLQGEDLSSAVGKSIKTAAYGAIAGWALEGIGDWLEGLRYEAVPFEAAPGLEQIDVGFKETISWGGNTIQNELGSMVVPADQVDKFKDLLQGIKEATAVTGQTTDPGAINAFEELWTFAKTFDKAEFIKDMNLENSVRQAIAAQNDSFLQNLTAANNVIAATAQGSLQASGNEKLKVGSEEIKPEQGELDLQGGSGTKNTESMELEFEKFLIEKGVLDKIGSGLKSGAAAIGGAAKAVGKELGNKITKQKLVSQWKKMGEPTDTASIFNVLTSAGLTDEQIAAIASETGVELKAGEAGAEEPAADTGTADAGADAEAPAQTGADAPKIEKGKIVKGPEGDDYEWLGAQWVNKKTGRMASKDVAPELNKTASAPAPKADAPAGAGDTAPTIKPGDTREVAGKQYKWEGALWTDLQTGRPVGVIPSLKLGLPNPKLDPIVAAAKKDPKIGKLIKDQITAKGVKAGTAGAAQAKTAGVKGDVKLNAKGVTKSAPSPTASGISKPNTVTPKPKPATV